MLLPDNIHPENTIYYQGAFVLKILQQSPRIDLLELYTQAKAQHEISIPVFLLCLDWLFLLDLITLDNEMVVLCS